MAEEQDQESKTEEPTEKRIADAVSKGNVPVAREATLFGSLAAILGVLLLLAHWSVSQITRTLREGLVAAGSIRLEDREAAAAFITSLLVSISAALLPLMAIVAAGTVLASLVQNKPDAASERITPRVSRVSLLAGWTRLFGKVGLIEFVKSVLKITAAAAVLWFALKNDLQEFASALSVDPYLLPAMLLDGAAAVLIPLLVLALLLAIADMVWSRLRWRKELRMTPDEVRREMKEAEGDPLLKARIRNVARQRVRHQII